MQRQAGESSPMSPRERAVLAVVCDALHPSLPAEPGDDALLFATSASDLDVPGAAEAAIARLSHEQQSELRQFLLLIDNPVFGLIVAHTPRGIQRMSPEQRAAFLLHLSASRLPQLRSGFQALKRLASFLYYSVTDASGTSRVWPSIGYEPSARPAPGPSALTLRVTTLTEPTTLEADVCIVGSGAGGGVVAAMLAARGMRVLVLEAGTGDQTSDFTQRELESTQRLFLDSGLLSSRDLGVAILAGACLGGGTAVNWQTSLRTPGYIRDEWSESSGCEHFATGRFSRALDAVCARAGVSTDESIVNANNAPLRRGCDALGYSWTAIARNSRSCDPAQCGYCTFGCRVGGKQSTANTFLHDAQAHGDATIVAGCTVDRVATLNGRVTGVYARSRDAAGRPVQITVHASRVVAAAGGIQTPALLLRSRLTLPQIGRNLFLHPAVGVAGIHADAIRAWSGPPQTILSNQFATLDGNYGFRLEAAPVHPGLLAFGVPWPSAAHHRRLMQRCANASIAIALVRDSTAGHVRVRRDGSAVVDYAPGAAERKLIARGTVEAIRVQLAAGADEVHTQHTRGLFFRRTPATTQGDIDRFCERVMAEPVDRNRSVIFSAHQMGTCRMGTDPAAAVCDERGEVFGVKGLYVADASAFPSSSGVNPMISVMALARCVAEAVE
ncbi:MAG: hypothetical protein JWM41_3373 [Gemmatimonadetes bacterium]|nr:hypothetical protein [Gemmatimonadota bacterium]